MVAEWVRSVLLLVNTSLDSLRSVWVRLRDASASVPGGFGMTAVVVDGSGAWGVVTCWVMLRTRLSDDLVRRMNMALFVGPLFDVVQLRFRALIGLLVVRCNVR